MTPNKRTIETYMDAFRKTDRPQILSCLTDDVEWLILAAFHVQGKDDFVLRSLDSTLGLDTQAIRALKAWRFSPGTLEGKPVPVVVTVELSFRVK